MLLAAVIALSAPVLAQAQTSFGNSTPEHSALRRFISATQTEAYLDSLTAPLWVEVEKRLGEANPNSADTVATVVRDSRQHYREQILQSSLILIPGATQRFGAKAGMPLLVERALPYAATPAGKELAERMDFESILCFVKRRTGPASANCAPYAAEFENLRTSGDQARDAYINLLISTRFVTAAAMQMSMASGNSLVLVDQRRVKAAGLTWPE